MRDQKGGTHDESGNANRTSIQRWRTHPDTGLHTLEVIHAAGLIGFDFGEGSWHLPSTKSCLSRLSDYLENVRMENVRSGLEDPCKQLSRVVRHLLV